MLAHSPAHTLPLSLAGALKVRRAAVIDGDGVDGVGGAKGDAGADPFSMDAYYAALEEEVKVTY